MRAHRVLLCARCALRFDRGPECPRCRSSRDVFDGREQGIQHRARAALVARARWKRVRLWLGELRAGLRPMSAAIALSLGALLVVGLGAAVVASNPNESLATKLVCALFALVIALAPLILYALRPRLILRRGDADRAERVARDRELARSPRIESWTPELPATPIASTIGYARGDQRLLSPLTRTPCLAWRIVGHGPTGSLDEAGATSFLVEWEGELDEVDGGAITIAIDPTSAPAPITPDAALAGFLARAFAFPAEGPFVLAEALLRDGDRVRIEGASELVARSDGYRGSRDVDREDAPLVVREVRAAP